MQLGRQVLCGCACLLCLFGPSNGALEDSSPLPSTDVFISKTRMHASAHAVYRHHTWCCDFDSNIGPTLLLRSQPHSAFSFISAPFTYGTPTHGKHDPTLCPHRNTHAQPCHTYSGPVATKRQTPPADMPGSVSRPAQLVSIPAPHTPQGELDRRGSSEM